MYHLQKTWKYHDIGNRVESWPFLNVIIAVLYCPPNGRYEAPKKQFYSPRVEAMVQNSNLD